MEILYVTAVLAIFALCIALFSTARRILHSTPLTNGDLSLTQVERLTQSWEPIAQQSFEETSQPIEKPEPEYAEENLNMEEYLLPQVTTVAEAQTEEFVAPAVQTPMPELSRDVYLTEISEAPEIPVQPQVVRADRMEVQSQAVREDWMKVQPQSIREDRMKIESRAVRDDRMETSSPRTSHYILEYLLIGISVFVLVKTQKSVSEHRSLQSSNRVA